MAISGAFAGLAGAMDILGWQFRLDLDARCSTYSQIAFIGIAVALLGRNTAVGIFFAALLFAALRIGTSTRNLDPDVFQPELACNLTQMIQGLVVLFVGADVLILCVWRGAEAAAAAGRGGERPLTVHAEASRRSLARSNARLVGIRRTSGSALLAVWLTLPPADARDPWLPR